MGEALVLHGGIHDPQGWDTATKEPAAFAAGPARSPLAETLARVSALDGYLAARLGEPEGEGWVLGVGLAAPGSPHLGTELERTMAFYTIRDKKAAASSLLMAYVWQTVAAAVGSALAERRVPDVASRNVALRFGAEPGVVFRSGRFAALPDDRDATCPDAVVVADEDQLLLWLRQRMVDSLAPLVAELRAWARFSSRALWGIAADRCADAFLWVGKVIGEQGRARREAEVFLGTPGAPWRDVPTFFTLAPPAPQEVFLNRSSCCLSHKLPDGRKCTSCPLLPAEERERRLKEIVAARASG